LAIGVLVVLLIGRAVAADSQNDFPSRLESLAAKCDELGLKEQAEITRGWIVERHPGRQYLFLPDAADPAATKASGDLVEKWQAKFLELRTAQAEALFEESKQALGRHDPARAYQLLYEVLRENPDHAEARRILGYNQTSRGWMLPEWERMAAQPGRFDHSKLGWRARAYWRLETPHFELVTNHSAKEALEAGRQLEDLHALWRQIFFRYWSTEAGLAARFAGGREPLARPRPKMQVVLFKSREEYVARLAPNQPQIGVTLGIYLDRERTAFFYAGDTSVYPTWQHEATHQLFQESIPNGTARPGEEQNFWAIEGAALYMESLVKHDGYWTAGGCEADRLQFARYRALAGDFSQPLAQLVTLGREDLQTSADIRKLYAQAAGVAQFLLDGNDGKHREAFIDLLVAIYQGEDAADSLAQATGQPYPSLDEQYRAFLNVTDDDLAGIPDVARIRNLSLGRTTVTDEGLARLAGAKDLEWLDLSLTAASDEGLKSIAVAAGLKQLFLEGTQVTDASLPVIERFRQLEELDLSKLAITDEGLASLAGLKNLKILYLTGSPISDAGLMHLRGCKQLEMLETTGTQVTAEGLKRLRGGLPKLK
jgi:hypothetical protein